MKSPLKRHRTGRNISWVSGYLEHTKAAIANYKKNTGHICEDGEPPVNNMSGVGNETGSAIATYDPFLMKVNRRIKNKIKNGGLCDRNKQHK